MITVAAVALLAGAAACRPQAPGSPSARGNYVVSVSNSLASSCFLRYQKRRELPIVEVGYVLPGDKRDFVVSDPDSRSLPLLAECGSQRYSRLMRLVPGDTLKLVVPSTFRGGLSRAASSGALAPSRPSLDSASTNRRPGAPQVRGAP